MTAEDRQLIDVVIGMFSELSADLRALHDENKRDHIEQQKATAELDKKVSEALKRLDQHDAWHGKNDSKIAARLDGIAGSKHDEEVRQDAVRDYKRRFSWLGELGHDALKTVAMAVVGLGLLGVGWLVGRIF